MGPVVIFLPVVADSIHYVPHEQCVAGSTLIEDCLTRIREVHAYDDVFLVHEGAPSDLLQRGAATCQWALVERKGRCETTVLQAVAESMHADAIVCGLLEMSLAPRSLPARHWEWHTSHRLSYSAVLGVPERVSAEIITTQTLRALNDLKVPGAPARLCSFIQGIERLGGAQMGVDITIGRLDARSVLPCESADLPAIVSFETPDDLECAAAAMKADHAGDEWAVLRRWKQQRIAKQRAVRDEARSPNGRASPARVLFVSNPSACSGAEESLCQAVAHLDRTRYLPAAMIALEGEFAERLRAAGAEVTVPNQDFGRDTLAGYRLVLQAIEKHQPDLIHVNAPSGLPLIYAAWDRRIPLVPHVRQAEVRAWSPVFQTAPRIIAVSSYIRTRVLEMDVEPSRLDVVYDGVDASRLYPGVIDRTEARMRLGVSTDAAVLLCVARYVKEKRLDLFCKVIARLRKRWPSIQGIIVGDPKGGPEVAAEVATLIDDLCLMGSVRQVGFQQDIRYCLAAADAIVLCSEREPLGTCVLEAFAMGIPGVVTRSGGLVELIEEFDAGILVSVGSEDGLEDALQRLLSSEQLRSRIRRGGLQAIRSKCSSPASANRMMEVFDTALAG